jgi:hypothetical protein
MTKPVCHKPNHPKDKIPSPVNRRHFDQNRRRDFVEGIVFELPITGGLSASIGSRAKGVFALFKNTKTAIRHNKKPTKTTPRQTADGMNQGTLME